MAFVFGLVHGLGFASVLSDLGLSGANLALALVGFNGGVELGQFAIVMLFLPVALLVRDTVFYQRVFVPVGSGIIGVVAALWLITPCHGLHRVTHGRYRNLTTQNSRHCFHGAQSRTTGHSRSCTGKYRRSCWPCCCECCGVATSQRMHSRTCSCGSGARPANTRLDADARSPGFSASRVIEPSTCCAAARTGSASRPHRSSRSTPSRPESSLTQRTLERCLSLLSGDQRQCLVLAYQHGLTQDDIALTIGHPLGTVKSWVRRALSLYESAWTHELRANRIARAACRSVCRGHVARPGAPTICASLRQRVKPCARLCVAGRINSCRC